MITCDTAEQNKTIQSLSDERRKLSYEGENGEHYSYDIEVVTAAGERAIFERKSMEDAIGSFRDGKLDRQVANTHGLIVEWVPSNYTLANMGNPGALTLMENCRKHLQRMAMYAPVVITTGADDTIAFLRHLESRPELGAFRDNNVKAGSESTLSALYRILPGVNPDRRVGDHKLFDELRTRFMASKFDEALGLDGWIEIPGVGQKTVDNIKEAIRRD